MAPPPGLLAHDLTAAPLNRIQIVGVESAAGLGLPRSLCNAHGQLGSRSPLARLSGRSDAPSWARGAALREVRSASNRDALGNGRRTAIPFDCAGLIPRRQPRRRRLLFSHSSTTVCRHQQWTSGPRLGCARSTRSVGQRYGQVLPAWHLAARHRREHLQGRSYSAGTANGYRPRGHP